MNKIVAAAAALAFVGLAGSAYAQEAPGPYGLGNANVPSVAQNVQLHKKDRIVTSSTAGYSTQAVQHEPRFRWNQD